MSLAIYTSAAWTANGGLQVADNATIEVRRESDGGLATIFSDREGEEPITNPSAFGDASGRFEFFAAGGAYRVKVTQDGQEHTLRYQAIGTAAAEDVSAFDAAGSADAAETAAKSYTDDHATETGGIHGIPDGERALHTADLGPAPSEVPTNQQLADGVERDQGDGALYYQAYKFDGGTDGSDQDWFLLCRADTGDNTVTGTIYGARSSDTRSNGQAHVSVTRSEFDSDTSGVFTATAAGADAFSLKEVDWNGNRYIALKMERPGNAHWSGGVYFSGFALNPTFQVVSDSSEISNETDLGQERTPNHSGRPGDIVESGSNSNGHYVRWENGEQVCWAEDTVDMTDGAPFRRDFPAGFASYPAQWYASGRSNANATPEEHQALYGGGDFGSALRGGYDTTEWLFPRENDSSAPTDCPIRLIAWGFWK